jgi:hypothetical protein
MELETFFSGILPVMAGFVSGLFATRVGKLAVVTLVLASFAMMLTGLVMPLKQALMSLDGRFLSQIVDVAQSLYVTIPAGFLVGALLAIAAHELFGKRVRKEHRNEI